MMPTTTTKREVVTVTSFGMEADHPRNCDLLLQGLQVRLRSAIKPTKEVFDREEGEQITRPVNAQMLDGLPRICPGMQIHVNPGALTYKIIDPLHGDEEALKRIEAALRNSAGFNAGSLKGMKPKKGTLDRDQMKTLVRELFCLIEAEEGRIVRGKAPILDDIEELPGEFLTNPSNANQWNQPRHEKDLGEWKDRLNRLT